MAFSPVERIGVHSVALQVLREFGWPCREQFTDDWGIDAQLEVVNEGKLSGRLVGLQIKSGLSYFNEEVADGYVFRGEARHLELWRQHSLPVILALYHPGTNSIHWQIVRDEFVEYTKTAWKIVVPRQKTLTKEYEPDLRAVALPKFADRRRYDYLAALINGFTDKLTNAYTAIYALYASFFAAQHEICVATHFLSTELLDALSVASSSVNVRILYNEIASTQLSLSEYRRHFPHLNLRQTREGGRFHAKFYVLDGTLVVHTSSSMSVRNPNFEVFWATSDSPTVREGISQFR